MKKNTIDKNIDKNASNIMKKNTIETMLFPFFLEEYNTVLKSP